MSSSVNKYITRKYYKIIFSRKVSSTPEKPQVSENSRIRNFGISAHIDSGKTTLTERILFYTRRIREMHEVKTKTGPTMDFMQLERERGITIQSAATYTSWKGHTFNLIDTPGHVDFTIEVERALRVLDGAILVLCAVGGVQTQTFTVHRQMNRYKVPFIALINKLDRWNACPFRTLADIRKKLKLNAAFLNLPIGVESNFSGIIDIIKEEALYFEGTQGLHVSRKEIPLEYLPQVKDYRNILIENLSNIDERIGELYLNDKIPTVEEFNNAIRRGVLKREFLPVNIGSALKNKGIQLLLDSILNFLPNPSEIENKAFRVSDGSEVILNPQRGDRFPSVSLAFKLESGTYGQLTYMRIYQGQISKGDILMNTRTNKRIRVPRLVLVHAKEMKEAQVLTAGDIGAFFGVECNSGDTFIKDGSEPIAMESMFIPEPVMSLSIEISSSEDMMKLAKAFSKFQKEDPTFRVHTDPDTRETIISGMGELHLEIYTQRLNLEYGIKISVGKPKVSYRETLREVERFEYLHKRQTGGRGQYAHIIGRVEPLPQARYEFIEFLDETTGLAIPKSYIPYIQKGFYEACERGYLSGHKISGIRFVIENGSIHEVDSSEYSFRLATIGAMREISMRKNSYLIEPIMIVEIIIPIEFRGAVNKIIKDRLGIIKDFDIFEEYTTIKAEVSLSNMFGFTGAIRQVTQGKGEYSMEFSHYDEVPFDRQDEIIKAYEGTVKTKNKK